MTKTEILNSIRRIAADNGGKAPGSQRVATETGMRKSDWYPKLWVRWSDAVREAGLAPNSLAVAPPDVELIKKHIAIIRQLDRFPIDADLRLQPNARGLSRLGTKRERAAKVLQYCRTHKNFEDVIELCEATLATMPSAAERPTASPSENSGYVCLLKHGNRAEYKIGRTVNPVRREGEVRLELPERLAPIHYVQTDDPAGIEAYWHRRFADKRKQGEWFALSVEDVRAFKRWKRIF
jgi:hypothetical protein